MCGKIHAPGKRCFGYSGLVMSNIIFDLVKIVVLVVFTIAYYYVCHLVMILLLIHNKKVRDYYYEDPERFRKKVLIPTVIIETIVLIAFYIVFLKAFQNPMEIDWNHIFSSMRILG